MSLFKFKLIEQQQAEKTSHISLKCNFQFQNEQKRKLIYLYIVNE